MAYCTNCGQPLSDDAKFCSNCGNPTTMQNEQRRTVYEGELHKCPNCGELLDSFITHCPSCNCEIRGSKATSSVRELSLKLEAIESQRENENDSGIFGRVNRVYNISKTDEQKITLIKSFAIPNTKEDILEFMILATSNVDLSVYSSLDSPSAGVKAVTDAWHAKIKQTYAKAKNIYKNDKDFAKIQELFDSCYADIEKQKKKKIIKWILSVAWIPILLAVIIILLLISSPKEEAKELERLDNIVLEVQEALDNEEYKHALRIADSIDYQRYDVEMERKWDIQREYWVEKVIEEAQKNGIELEYTPTPDIDNTNNNDNEETNIGFVGGFMDAIQSGLDSAEENIDEFNDILNGNNSTENNE